MYRDNGITVIKIWGYFTWTIAGLGAQKSENSELIIRVITFEVELLYIEVTHPVWPRYLNIADARCYFPWKFTEYQSIFSLFSVINPTPVRLSISLTLNATLFRNTSRLSKNRSSRKIAKIAIHGYSFPWISRKIILLEIAECRQTDGRTDGKHYRSNTALCSCTTCFARYFKAHLLICIV